MIELTKELLTTEAEEVVKKNSKLSNKKATSTQIRKFYDDFLLLHTKSQGKTEEEFRKTILPMIYFAKAKLAYAVGRDVLDSKFKEELEKKIDKIDSKKDFDNFILFYQAVIGYSKFILDSKQSNSFQRSSSFKSNSGYNKKKL